VSWVCTGGPLASLGLAGPLAQKRLRHSPVLAAIGRVGFFRERAGQSATPARPHAAPSPAVFSFRLAHGTARRALPCSAPGDRGPRPPPPGHFPLVERTAPFALRRPTLPVVNEQRAKLRQRTVPELAPNPLEGQLFLFCAQIHPSRGVSTLAWSRAAGWRFGGPCLRLAGDLVASAALARCSLGQGGITGPGTKRPITHKSLEVQKFGNSNAGTSHFAETFHSDANATNRNHA